MVRKILFSGKNFKIELLHSLKILDSLNLKIMFSVLGQYAFYQNNSKINSSSTSKFGILYPYVMEIMVEITPENLTYSLCIETYKRIITQYDLWATFLITF